MRAPRDVRALPTTLHRSLAELARHGGDTGPHRDGWGVAFVQERDAFVLREPAAASRSAWLAFLQEQDLRGDTVIAHVRRATQGGLLLRNSQPFAGELGGRVHLFVHNGMLPGIEDDRRFASGRFRRIGDTDSEHAFCGLLDRLTPIWEVEVPPLEARVAVIAGFARDLRELGPANFIYPDGDAVSRTRTDGSTTTAKSAHLVCTYSAATASASTMAWTSR